MKLTTEEQPDNKSWSRHESSGEDEDEQIDLSYLDLLN